MEWKLLPEYISYEMYYYLEDWGELNFFWMKFIHNPSTQSE